MIEMHNILGAPEVSANLYCNSRTSVLGRLRDYLRLLMGRTLYRYIPKSCNLQLIDSLSVFCSEAH